MATAPTLFWYQLDSGTLSATYFGQLNATVAELCSENAVTAPTAPWQNSIGGTLFSKWQTQIDTAVRSLCTALVVTEPIPLAGGSNAGQYQSEYLESLDGVVRALCVAGPSYEGPLDLVPGAVVAYGQRALSAAMLGASLYTIQRDSDSSTQSFNSDATTGEAPVASIQAFIGSPFTHTGAIIDTTADIVLVSAAGVAVGQPVSGTGIQVGSVVTDISAAPTITISLAVTATNPAVVLTFTRLGGGTIWNDQSGADNDISGGGSPGQITWGASVQGGKPGFTGEAGLFAGATSSFPNGAATVFFVGSGVSIDRDGDPSYLKFETGLGADLTLQLHQGANNAGGILDAPPSGLKLWEGRVQFGQRELRINGAVTAFDTILDDASTIGSFTETMKVLSLDATCQLVELIVYPSYLSDVNAAAVRTNIATYYGLTLS